MLIGWLGLAASQHENEEQLLACDEIGCSSVLRQSPVAPVRTDAIALQPVSEDDGLDRDGLQTSTTPLTATICRLVAIPAFSCRHIEHGLLNDV
jgi:hypothetical protein